MVLACFGVSKPDSIGPRNSFEHNIIFSGSKETLGCFIHEALFPPPQFDILVALIGMVQRAYTNLRQEIRNEGTREQAKGHVGSGPRAYRGPRGTGIHVRAPPSGSSRAQKQGALCLETCKFGLILYESNSGLGYFGLGVFCLMYMSKAKGHIHCKNIGRFWWYDQ